MCSGLGFSCVELNLTNFHTQERIADHEENELCYGEESEDRGTCHPVPHIIRAGQQRVLSLVSFLLSLNRPVLQSRNREVYN